MILIYTNVTLKQIINYFKGMDDLCIIDVSCEAFHDYRTNKDVSISTENIDWLYSSELRGGIERKIKKYNRIKTSKKLKNTNMKQKTYKIKSSKKLKNTNMKQKTYKIKSSKKLKNTTIKQKTYKIKSSKK